MLFQCIDSLLTRWLNVMKWGIWMSPIWAALNKKLALFMNDYNGALKHHRCRRCRYKDGTNASQCQRFLVKSIFTFMRLFFFKNTFSQLFKQSSARTSKIPAAPQVGPGRFDLFALIVNWSASPRALKPKESTNWGATAFLLKILIKHHLLIFLFPFQMLTFLNFLRPCKHM